ncbi:Malonate-CoA ligase ACSF3, mitochondrial [Coccomyxa sp. Obi]|nr:Malonate-CoA ligase ACSF3, mitochondrial [Coccomyxa sp. Obi]
MEIFRRTKQFLDRAAVAAGGCSYSYGDILRGSHGLAKVITDAIGSGSNSPRIAVMTPPGREYVEATWGAWLAKGTPVPLCTSHPAGELQYVLEDAQAKMLLTSPRLAEQMEPIAKAAGVHVHIMGQASTDESFPQDIYESLDVWSPEDDALIVYTSGTTGRPKGALHTHGNLSAQIQALVESWEWSENDRILHALPLHHVHGIINALHCAHAAGAAVEFLPKFSPGEVWKCLMREEDPITVFMGVPTMYSYLLSYYAGMAQCEQAAARAAASRLRLTVSGSAACPLPVMHKWHELSGQWLLERYGMTETNMILSNPYRGERRPGSVGLPLPGVEVRAVTESATNPGANAEQDNNIPSAQEGPGELHVRGPNVFKEYINKPDATAQAFDELGWFRTGDTAVFEGTPPHWRILGRTNVDIIKSGGYKISALAIENAILSNSRIRECAVLGLPDESLGEVIAVVVACQNPPVTLIEIQEWLSDKLPPYQVPTRLKILDSIPRNAMGKINKKALRYYEFVT